MPAETLISVYIFIVFEIDVFCLQTIDDNVSDDIKGNLKKRQRSVLFMKTTMWKRICLTTFINILNKNK